MTPFVNKSPTRPAGSGVTNAAPVNAPTGQMQFVESAVNGMVIPVPPQQAGVLSRFGPRTGNGNGVVFSGVVRRADGSSARILDRGIQEVSAEGGAVAISGMSEQEAAALEARTPAAPITI